jgi:hypothetical protein
MTEDRNPAPAPGRGREAPEGDSRAAGPEPRARAVDRERIEYLATGFALNELDDAGMRELYDALRRPGDEGLRAARLTWDVLGSTVDLRAVLSRQFQDTVAHRIASGECASGREGFVAAVLERLGIGRPRLQEVRPPSERATLSMAGRTRTVLVVLSVSVPLLAAAAGLALWGPRGALASVDALRGLATVEGRAVSEGDGLDGRPLAVTPGSVLRVGWPDGSSAVFAGPTSISPQKEGFSLASGRAWVETPVRFTVGLPDRKAVLSPGTRAAFEVHGYLARSVAAVGEGGVRLVAAGVTSELAPGFADTGRERFRWASSAVWSADGSALALDCDPAATAWRVEATVEWGTPADGVEMEVAEDGTRTVVSLRPGLVTVTGLAWGERLELPGAPLLSTRFELVAGPHQEGAELRVEGLRRPVDVAVSRCPTGIRLHGRARLTGVTFEVGPARSPPPALADAPAGSLAPRGRP